MAGTYVSYLAILGPRELQLLLLARQHLDAFRLLTLELDCLTDVYLYGKDRPSILLLLVENTMLYSGIPKLDLDSIKSGYEVKGVSQSIVVKSSRILTPT